MIIIDENSAIKAIKAYILGMAAAIPCLLVVNASVNTYILYFNSGSAHNIGTQDKIDLHIDNNNPPTSIIPSPEKTITIDQSNLIADVNVDKETKKDAPEQPIHLSSPNPYLGSTLLDSTKDLFSPSEHKNVYASNLSSVENAKPILNQTSDSDNSGSSQYSSLKQFASLGENFVHKYNGSDPITLDLSWPVQGTVISKFGMKIDGRLNDGINIAAPEGAPVLAAMSGVVIYANDEIKEFGNVVLIKHPNDLTTVYAHVDAVLVKRGQSVTKGQKISSVGSTGNVTSPQLHFELRYGNIPIDPSIAFWNSQESSDLSVR